MNIRKIFDWEDNNIVLGWLFGNLVSAMFNIVVIGSLAGAGAAVFGAFCFAMILAIDFASNKDAEETDECGE